MRLPVFLAGRPACFFPFLMPKRSPLGANPTCSAPAYSKYAQAFFFWLRRGTSVAAIFLVTSCSTVPVPAKIETAPRPAQLVLINLSDYAWQVRASSSAGGESHLWSLAARETSKVELLAGDYVIEQTVLLKPDAPGATRRFAFTADAGEEYRWRLGTLLSEPGAEGESK